MADLFRKSSLEKLSSPEQLDKMIVITPPSFWLAMAGAAFIVVTALVWSIYGRLPENVDAQGIYVNRAGIQSVYCEGNGVVSELKVEDGDTVKKGDIIAVLDTSEIDGKIAEYEAKKAAVESVSIDAAVAKGEISSNEDVLALYSDLYQSVKMLQYQTQQLNQKRKAFSVTEQKYLALEAEYYNSMNVGDSTKENLEYQEKQSAYASAGQYADQAEGSYKDAKSQYDSYKSQYNSYKSQYEALKTQYETLNAQYKTLKAQFDAQSSSNNDGSDDGDAADGGGSDNSDGDSTTLDTGTSDISTSDDDASGGDTSNIVTGEQLSALWQQVVSAEGAMNEAEISKEKAKSSMVAAEKSMNAAEETYEDYVEEKETAEQKYENAKAIYIEKVKDINQAQAQQSELGNRYNVISNQYGNEKSAIQNLEDSVAQSQIQINVTKTYILSSLKTEYKQYLDQKEASEIKATSDGRISDLAVAVGSVLGQGTEVAKIQKGDNSDRVVVCYVPVSDGRKVQKDMKVLIYPSTVNKQEYGHMEATVVNVDDYITSTTDMQQQLGDSNLVESFMQNGPVVEVHCELKEDASTVSGYYWSSSKGASVNIDGGTMVEASVVISEKPPISLLIPFLKEKLTIKADN